MKERLQLQKFLSTHSLAELENAYHVYAKRHKQYPNLVLFKYDQLESPFNEQIVQESRGIILDENKNWDVVAFPYTKFFNYGEGNAAKVDWSRVRVYEKLDGSLITMYWYDGAWQIATSGTPDASGTVNNDPNRTFRDLFWDTWNELGYVAPHSRYSTTTFMFELMTPFNRVVIKYEKPRIVLHGIRYIGDHLDVQFEMLPSDIPFGWEVVKLHKLGRLEEILATSKVLNPLESEGYVVVDENFNRVKIKNPGYVAIAHLVDRFSTRRLLEILQLGEENEFEVYLKDFPEWKDSFYKTKNAYAKLLEDTLNNFNCIKHIENQKEFASQATKLPHSGALFGLRNNKFKSVNDYFSKLNIKALEETIKEYSV